MKFRRPTFYCSDIEILLDLISVAWGIWLIVVCPNQTIFQFFMSIAPLSLWAALAISAGFFNILSFFFKIRARYITRLALVFFWTFAAVSFVVSEWTETSTVVYPFFALGYIYILIGGR